MFSPGQWAQAFVRTMDNGTENSNGIADSKSAEEAFAVFKIICEWIEKLPGAIFGTISEKQLAGRIRAAAEKTGLNGSAPFEKASRFALLLVRKNYFRHSEKIISEIQKALDNKKKYVSAVLESVTPADTDFENEIKKIIAKQTGAAEVRVENKIKPGLIGGYRIRIGDTVYDSSISSQLKQMETGFIAAISENLTRSTSTFDDKGGLNG